MVLQLQQQEASASILFCTLWKTRLMWRSGDVLTVLLCIWDQLLRRAA
jgi:hypothetical protein